MKAYILSVVGMILLSVVVELVLPEGKLSAYVRSTIALFLFFVIASPIVKLVKGNNVVENLKVELQDNFLQQTAKAQMDATKNRVQNSLNDNFGIETNVELTYENKEGVAFVCAADVWVIKSSDKLHTNGVDELVGHVAALLKIEKEQVNVYE